MVRTWIYCFRLTGCSLPEFASLYSVTQFCLVSLALHAYALPLISGNLTVELTDLAWCSFSTHHFLFLNSYEIDTRVFICLVYQNGQGALLQFSLGHWPILFRFYMNLLLLYSTWFDTSTPIRSDLLLPTLIRLAREILLSSTHECTNVQCKMEKYRTAIWSILFRF